MRRTSLAFILTILIANVATAQGYNPPARVGRLSALRSAVSFQPSGSDEWSDAPLNYTITRGDRLYTADRARAEIEIGAMSVRLGEQTDVTVTELSDTDVQLALDQGALRLTVYRMSRAESIEIDTPNGAVIIRGPGEYRVDVPDDRYSEVVVDRGDLDIVGPGLNQQLRSGQAVQLSGLSRIRAVSIPRPAPDALDDWSRDRDTRFERSSCDRYLSPDIPGCEDMFEYGDWEMYPEYGYVWYPRSIAADWAPYRDGRWVWIDPWGWSWVDDSPWGYAPFHYGRWTRVRERWAWIPGPATVRPVYAPALVAFVGGSGWQFSFGVGAQAWFPLGPSEVYYPAYHCDDDYLRRVNVSGVRNVTNITTIIEVQRQRPPAYVNRTVAMTAVPTETFRNGRRISSDAVHVRPEEAVRAPVVSHPAAAPTERATMAGNPVTAPRVGPRPVQRNAERREPPGQARRDAPPPGQTRRDVPPPDPVPPVSTKTPPPPPPPGRGRDENPPARGAPPQGQREVITRRDPPPEPPPFKAKEPAMQQHPGKPLEPQQVQNIQRGREAGPPRDREVPPHGGGRADQPPPPQSAGRGAPPQPPPPQRGAKSDSGRGRGRGRQ